MSGCQRWSARVLAAVVAACLLLPSATALAADAAAPVNVAGTSFVPATVHVAPGALVQWTNTSLVAHTVTADDGAFDSGPLDPGATFSVVLDTPGVYQYFCQTHGSAGLHGMAGTVVVDDPSAGAVPAVVQRTPDDYMPTESD